MIIWEPPLKKKMAVAYTLDYGLSFLLAWVRENLMQRFGERVLEFLLFDHSNPSAS